MSVEEHIQEPVELLKSSLVVLASAAGGFYLGGRYVGDLALPSYTLEPPAWLSTAQETMWLSLGAMAICAGGWMIIDYIHTE